MREILRTNFVLVLFLNVWFVSNFGLSEANNKHQSVENYGLTDSNLLDVENPIQNNKFNNLSDKFIRRKNERNRKFRKYKRIQKEVDIMDDTTKSEDVECHKAAVWKCGHRFIRAHKFLDFIGNEDSFEPKCALRNAFFVCLKTSKTKYCHKHKSTHTEKFRKRLADTLWSTRACLLGVSKQ